MTNENLNSYQEQEVSPETINRYVNNIHDLSVLTGKLDIILSYSEQFYKNDKFLLQSLNSVLEDILRMNQDNKYKRMSCVPETETSFIPILDEQEGVLNTKKVQSLGVEQDVRLSNAQHLKAQKKIKGALKANLKDNNDKVVKIETNIIEYKFKNSSLLDSISYNRASQKLRAEFKSNGRLYDYLSVPFDKINKLIALDEINQNPGKYFISEIRDSYEYREVTKDNEEMIG